MTVLEGRGASAGVAGGPIHFLHRREEAKRRAGEPEVQKRRLRHARKSAIAQLESLAERCRAEAGEEAAALFETHAMLAEDEDFTGRIHSILETEKCNAEYAVQRAGEEFAAMLAAMEDEYMRERAADIRDVARRIMDNLSGEEEAEVDPAAAVILAADELSPSETMRLDRSKILAFITRQGSANSHSAILARSMGIPAVCALGDALKEDFAGRTAYVDGESGRVIIDPDAETIAALEEKKRGQRRERARLEALKGREDITPDGRRVDVYCNIGSPEDVAAVLENDGRGIGLFRSEFLYLAARGDPGEEAQFQAYRHAAQAMGGKRVIIRTLDAGADKQLDFLNMPPEENPALGMRGVRVCLERPKLFLSQLRAIYRASAYGKVAVMFPMIASLWELRACRRACREAMESLSADGLPFDANAEIGVMIETPASVLIAAELARESDFLSVGTNDLTQYLLACDRQSGAAGRFFDPRHPALLHALKLVADAAHGAGIWLGVCGELAADPEMLPAFLALGIDELSVSPASVLPLRERIRNTPAKDCKI